MADIRISFPVDLGKGREVTDEVAEQYFQHVEKDVARGFFPLGHNTVWHGGVHVYGAEDTPVYAMFDGTVVAAKVAAPADDAVKGFGSVNFLVVKHEVRGSALNSVAQQHKYKNSRYYTFYSLYMHLGSLDLEAGNGALSEIGWLTKPAEHELGGSVGAGGSNKKADVELIQTLLTQAGIECGPIDGGCGSKTINGIKTFQDTYLYSNPDGRVDVGGSSWKALQFAALGTPSRDGIDEDLLGQLADGAAINPNKPVAGGQQLWVMGNDTPAKSTWMIQWEVFAEENLFNDFTAVADEGNYTADPTLIRSTLKADAWLPGDDITSQQVADFYANHPDAKKLREYVVKFRSEWAADLDAMMAALAKRFWTEGLRDELEPYMWYAQLQESAELPDPLHYHYNPTRFMQMLRDMEHRRELPPPPPPPPPGEDDDELEDGGDAKAPNEDNIFMYDAGNDLVYMVPKATFEKLLGENAKLAAKRREFEAAAKAAKDLPKDQQINAVKPSLKELAELTGTKPDAKPDEAPQRLFREYWYRDEDDNVRPIAIGDKQYSKLADKLNGSKLKDVIKIKKGEAHEFAKKGGRVDIEVFEHTFAKGEGSLLDFIDSANPGLLAFMMPNVVGADAFFEQFPRMFRRGYGDKWESPDGHFDASYEARFLRWAYEAKATALYDPIRGKAEAKIGIGGQVNLVSGKVDAHFYLPDKKGWKIPVTEGDGLHTRFIFTGEAGGFVGAVGELSVGTMVAWKPQVDEDDDFVGVRASGGLEAFAGAKIQGTLKAGVEWYNPDEKKWKMLAEFGASLIGAVGIGATIKFYIDFDANSGMFSCYFKYEIVVKIGFGQEFAGKVSVQEILTFVWELLKRADWGKILEMSFNAFIEASKMAVGAAIMGVLGPVGLGIYLITNFWSWWDSQDKITDLAENILNNKAPYLLEKGTPEAKGMAIYRLTQASWMWDETSETASLKVLKTAQSKREAEKILKSIDPKGRDSEASASDRREARTVQRGYDLMSGLVDWAEQTELDNYLAGLGISVS